MLSLCLLATMNHMMILKDCDHPDKLYAFIHGHEIMTMSPTEAIRVYGIDPNQPAKRNIKFIGYKLPADHEDLRK